LGLGIPVLVLGVLIWINLALRRDLGLVAKLTWAIAAIIRFVPFAYVLTGNPGHFPPIDVPHSG
jgi:hypothetical protein